MSGEEGVRCQGKRVSGVRFQGKKRGCQVSGGRKEGVRCQVSGEVFFKVVPTLSTFPIIKFPELFN